MAADSRIPTAAMTAGAVPVPAVTPIPVPVEKKAQNYKGFVAGVFSGVAKLTGESLLHIQSRRNFGAEYYLSFHELSSQDRKSVV